MADEQLILAATVKDAFSAPIAQMARQLRALVDQNQRGQLQGVTVSKLHAESFMKLSESVHRGADVFRKEFLPALEKVASQAFGTEIAFRGVAATAAAVGVAAAKMTFDFASNSQQLEILQRTTGLTVNELRGLESLGPRVGVSAEAMGEGIRSASGIFQTMRRDANGLQFEMKQLRDTFGDPSIPSAVKALKDLGPEKQVEGLFDIAQGIKEPTDREAFFRFFRLPENFAAFSASELHSYYEIYRKAHADISEVDHQAGLAARAAWLDLREQMGVFSDYVGANFAPTMTSALKSIVASFRSMQEGGGGAFGKLAADVQSAQGVPEAVKAIRTELALDGPLIKAALQSMLPDEGEIARTVALLIKDIARLAHLRQEIMSDPGGLIGRHFGARFGSHHVGAEAPPHEYKPFGLTWHGRQILGGPAAEPLHDRPAFGLDRLPTPPPPPVAPTPMPTPLVPPVATPAAPFALPRLDQFPKTPPPSTAPALPQFAPGYSPISFNPTDGLPNPLKTATPGAGSGESSAIRIIAVGTRKGVAEGLYDYFQAMRALGGKAAPSGIVPASYEGPGGPGAGAGGPGLLGGGVTPAGGGPAGGGAPPAPGDRAGSNRSGNTSDAMRSMADQLRREGVPEANVHAAAAELAGQALSESGLVPSTVHDSGTGYGIYGARLDRRDKMFGWLAAHGYAKNSLEGQSRYMAHEAMSMPGPRQFLMGATPQSAVADSGRFTRMFENPAVVNDRSANVRAALNAPVEPPAAPPKPLAGLVAPPSNIKIPNVYTGGQSSEYPAKGETSGSPPAPLHDRAAVTGALAKHGEALREIFGHRGPQRGGSQEAALWREPGSLLKAHDERQARAQEIKGSASLEIKLARGLAPARGVKTTGSLFKEVKLDRVSTPVASTEG